MRKVLFSMVGAVAVIAMTASLASGAPKAPVGHAAQCGGLYQPPCVAPTVIVRSAVACQQTGTTIKFPIHLHSNAGLSRATVKVGKKTIKKVTFPKHPDDTTLNVKVNTRGDKPGLYTMTVKATDTRGKSSTGRAHFTICKPAPVFTG
jgi:hypothetical protein